MNLFQNYIDFEPLSSFKDALLKEKSLKEANDLYFSHKLSFGTAGLRGLMQPGLCGINGYTIAKAACALGMYIKKNNPHKTPTFCISYDNRHHSMQFAEISARVLAHMGIHVKLSKHLRPTPWLSFAIRELKCDAGIMITASHNPKQYNGFKAYLHDGGQVVSPHDKEIMTLMDSIHELTFASANSSLIELIDENIDRKYIEMLKMKFKDHKTYDLSIVYSPLCGTGATIVPLALNEMGFHNLLLVDEEMHIDPDFAGISSPNPESEKACTRSIDLLLKSHADIALVTDPDADRIGIIINHHGKAIKPNGNQIAILILDYLIETMDKTKGGVVVNSFVTTQALEKMCRLNGLIHHEVLTGFKYIGQIIEELEHEHMASLFLLGAEESYGYLIGTHARDKDAIITACVLAKAASLAKTRKLTLYDRLLQIYEKYGLFCEVTHTLDFKEGTTAEQIKTMLEPILEKPPEILFGQQVLLFKNFLNQTYLDIQTQTTGNLDLPKTDALGLYTQNSWLVLRPSGTEPKLKIYAGTFSDDKKNIELAKESLEVKLKSMLIEFCKKHLS